MSITFRLRKKNNISKRSIEEIDIENNMSEKSIGQPDIEDKVTKKRTKYNLSETLGNMWGCKNEIYKKYFESQTKEKIISPSHMDEITVNRVKHFKIIDLPRCYTGNIHISQKRPGCILFIQKGILCTITRDGYSEIKLDIPAEVQDDLVLLSEWKHFIIIGLKDSRMLFVDPKTGKIHFCFTTEWISSLTINYVVIPTCPVEWQDGMFFIAFSRDRNINSKTKMNLVIGDSMKSLIEGTLDKQVNILRTDLSTLPLEGQPFYKFKPAKDYLPCVIKDRLYTIIDGKVAVRDPNGVPIFELYPINECFTAFKITAHGDRLLVFVLHKKKPTYVFDIHVFDWDGMFLFSFMKCSHFQQQAAQFLTTLVYVKNFILADVMDFSFIEPQCLSTHLSVKRYIIDTYPHNPHNPHDILQILALGNEIFTMEKNSKNPSIKCYPLKTNVLFGIDSYKNHATEQQKQFIKMMLMINRRQNAKLPMDLIFSIANFVLPYIEIKKGEHVSYLEKGPYKPDDIGWDSLKMSG